MQQKMMLYLLPAVMTLTTYYLAGAVGLYFLTGNLFSLVQEWIVRRKPRTQN
jgi:membrane protein insertase Oxa1/YidC/SpoIIIJ